MNQAINTDRRTFLIKFQWTVTDGQFIFQSGEKLMELLKTHGRKGIEYIKEFNPAKAKFERVSKIDILNCFNWETETSLFLNNHSYFKNIKS